MLILILVILVILATTIILRCQQSDEEGSCPYGIRWSPGHIEDAPEKRMVMAIKYLPPRTFLEIPQKIPRIIHQTHTRNEIPDNMQEAMETIISLNPEYEYRYYSDEDCRDFILKYLGSRVAKAYDSLIPGAYKADLFRYCVIYIKGGVYLDSGFVAINPL